jgi:alkylated DNA repair dioxygenase AlkB
MDDQNLDLPKAAVFVIHQYAEDTQYKFEYLKSHLNWSYASGQSGRKYCNMGADYLFDSDEFKDGEQIEPLVLKIMRKLNTDFSVAMNSAYASYYEDGHSELLFRSDKEQHVDLNQPIFILSYGAPRYITFKDIETNEEYDFLLKDGDLCIMSEHSQTHYLHAIKKSTEYTDPRIALSFRRFHNW